MATRSEDIFGLCLDYVISKSRLVGVNIFEKNYKTLNPGALNLLIQCFCYLLVTIYCVFEFQNSFEKLVFCLVTFGFAIQVRNDKKIIIDKQIK